jgi:hypothetical protein
MTQIPKADFFDFFRQRLANLKQLQVSSPSVSIRPFASFNPEINILLATELDALAKYWGLSQKLHFPLEKKYGEFLAKHGGPIWNKCNHTDLLDRASKEKTAVNKGWAAVLERELKRILGPVVWGIPGAVVPGHQDADFTVLSDNAEIKSAGIPAEWLQSSRYGEFLYRHYRSAWVHGLNPDPELFVDHHMVLDSDHSPHYIDSNGRRRLAIPTEFILVTLERALKSLESSMSKQNGVTIG